MIQYSVVPDLKPGELLTMEILGHLAVFIKRQGARCDLIWIYSAEKCEMIIADPHHWIRVNNVA